MRKIAIVTDSNSGISQRSSEELGVFVIPMPFTIDGDDYFELQKGDRIVIKSSDKKAIFVRTEQYNFLQILRNKLS